MNNKEIDKILKQKLEAISDTPPDYMWERIAAGIAQPATKIAFYQTKTFKIASIAALLLLISSTAWFFTTKYNLNKASEFNINTPLVKTNTTKNVNRFNSTNSKLSKPKKEVLTTNRQLKEETASLVDTSPSITKKQEAGKNKSLSKSNSKTTFKRKKLHTNIIASNSSSIVANSSQSSYKSGNKNPAYHKTTKNLSTEVSKENKDLNTTSTDIAITKNTVSAPVELKSSIIKQGNVPTKAKATKKLTITENRKALSKQTIITSNAKKNTISIPNKTITVNSNNNKSKEIEMENAQVTENTKTKVSTPITASTQKTTGTDKLSDSISSEVTSPINNSFYPKNRIFNRYGIGVHYGIEAINTGDKRIYTNNIDLSFNYQNLNFIFQTGAGIQYSKDQRDINLEYIKNEYLSTQLRFDSLSFVTDTTGSVSVVPVNPYYEDIYDSINHKINTSFYERYYSLRIPLLVGYEKDYKNIGLFIKGGFFYNYIIYRQKSKIYQPDNSSRTLHIQYSGEERRGSIIEYTLALGGEYRINKQLHFSAELISKFYQHSIFDKSIISNTKPWSIEGRIGLIYFLNN